MSSTFFQSKALRTKQPVATATASSRVASKPTTTSSLKIFDENVAIPGKSTIVTRRSEANRTALGELTNKSNQGAPAAKKAATATSTAALAKVETKREPVGLVGASRRVPLANKSSSSSLLSNVVIPQPKEKTQIVTKAKLPLAHSNIVVVEDEDMDDDMISDDDEKEYNEPMEIDEDQPLSVVGATDIRYSGMPQVETQYQQKKPLKALKNVDDIDMYDHDDPIFCSEYVNIIFKYFREKEIENKVDPAYMDKQVDINRKHRTIMVDWMAEVCVKFRLLTETMFLSVSIIDRFLQYKAVARQKLQLVGIAAMLIASKYEEIYTPEVQDFIYITASAYTREELLKMEKLILVTLDFNLNVPTPIHFLRRYSKAAHSDSKIHTLSKYLIELSLLEYKMVSYLPSEIAGAAVFIARRMTHEAPYWSDTIEFYSGYSIEDLTPCIRDLNSIVQKQSASAYQAITKKYSSPKLLSVAAIPTVDI